MVSAFYQIFFDKTHRALLYYIKCYNSHVMLKEGRYYKKKFPAFFSAGLVQV